jgi:uncharacterized membrane protein YeaQ/YmgE (transglycosylase-associated protein family)
VNLIISLLIGAVIGWLASMVMKTNDQMGSIANIVVGIVGAWLGAWLGGLIGVAPTSLVGSVLMSILGAAVLIGLLKALNIFK